MPQILPLKPEILITKRHPVQSYWADPNTFTIPGWDLQWGCHISHVYGIGFELKLQFRISTSLQPHQFFDPESNVLITFFYAQKHLPAVIG